MIKSTSRKMYGKSISSQFKINQTNSYYSSLSSCFFDEQCSQEHYKRNSLIIYTQFVLILTSETLTRQLDYIDQLGVIGGSSNKTSIFSSRNIFLVTLRVNCFRASPLLCFVVRRDCRFTLHLSTTPYSRYKHFPFIILSLPY